ncbi:M16 family metallopeptidase [Tropicibacter naphthalenivorans]|uniref:Protease 3 n=1 Tax=Tropicibacter naphthalenivorans TaxID=441103 RepID=A0A0P1GJW4_9RHOB|nr:pitrilysin family protein [Tropicibacter naphthalenivorans]CUH75732.1 Protease 3 precursor [Tropicibacter naphthalenivorans]SMC42644.1 Predicted Zn-dependent peptidase [Tropicibacter naphthalenivorans]
MTTQFATLSNGLRIVTEQMPSLQSTAVGLWVDAGGRHERPDQNGVAHFLEHMAFKGTNTRTALQIAEEIEDVGGYINAYTSREVTAYYARVLEADTALAVDVLADILRNPIFDQKEIETERHVILQEIGQAHDTPDDVIFDWLQEKAYPDQALGRTILGEADRVRRFDQADLARFVSEHYGPGQLILSAAGAVDHDALVAQAEQLFGDMTAREAMTPDSATFHGGEARKVKDLEQAHMALAFEGPGYRADNFYAAQIYSMVLGGGMSSRLFQKIREERGLCYTIFAQCGAYAETGMTTIYAGTSGEELPELATLTIEEMKRAAEDMTEVEVERARVQMKAGLLMGLESPSSRAERMARMVQIWGKVPPIEDTVAKIDAVTLADVRAFAENQATQAAPALALYGPVETAPTLEAIQSQRAA